MSKCPVFGRVEGLGFEADDAAALSVGGGAVASRWCWKRQAPVSGDSTKPE